MAMPRWDALLSIGHGVVVCVCQGLTMARLADYDNDYEKAIMKADDDDEVNV